MDAALLAGSGSGSAAETEALLVRLDPAGALTVVSIMTVALLSAASGPSAQVRIRPDRVQVGGPGEEETNVTSGGRVSTTVTDVTSDGPAFSMANSYPSVFPGHTGSAD